jgi:hypothetical protein
MLTLKYRICNELICILAVIFFYFSDNFILQNYYLFVFAFTFILFLLDRLIYFITGEDVPK